LRPTLRGIMGRPASKTPKAKTPKKGAGGRPTDYRPEYAEQARKLCELGATDADIADFFKVSDRSIYRWAAKFPEFSQALKAGKAASDDRVERSLYHRAVGYTFDSEKVFQHQGGIIRAKTKEHVPPDTTACIFWLKNRRRDEWRDKVTLASDPEDPLTLLIGRIQGSSISPVEKEREGE
jgi:hypothetical protein